VQTGQEQGQRQGQEQEQNMAVTQCKSKVGKGWLLIFLISIQLISTRKTAVSVHQQQHNSTSTPALAHSRVRKDGMHVYFGDDKVDPQPWLASRKTKKKSTTLGLRSYSSR